MGQYHLTVNLDKRQFLHPHKFGEGLKLMEFGNDSQGLLLGLTVLLASSNGRGGGDFGNRQQPPAGLMELVGSWAGDRIAIVGDYDDPGKFGAPDNQNIYDLCREDGEGEFQDISFMVIELLLSGGEGVCFSPRVMREEDPERYVRCVEMVHALPEWEKENHPVISGQYVFGGL